MTEAYARQAARAVLDLLPQRVAPSVKVIAELLRSWGVRSRHGEWSDAEAQADAARDVAALYASQPTVAEVRAQALKDAADEWQHGGWTVVTPALRTLEDRMRAADVMTTWLRSKAVTDA